ncbi:hypothetical protein [Mycolicibacterium moriokaense]|uniref:hypothetical protein n=1 Tax=Mycolicibacterium moriokaense TaxID=39691 RepID=UPI001F3E7FA3|nr:hypothetical protein [Mycolicibacterium moriokaense]
MGAGDFTAKVVADRRQRQVDRVGVDEADEQSKVRGDQRHHRADGQPIGVHIRTLGAK